jgi:hypothetical protein
MFSADLSVIGHRALCSGRCSETPPLASSEFGAWSGIGAVHINLCWWRENGSPSRSEASEYEHQFNHCSRALSGRPERVSDPAHTKEAADQRTLSWQEMFELIEANRASYERRVLRAIVYENLHAKKPLPSDIFTADFDERWRQEGDFIKRTYSGPELTKLLSR